MSGGYWNIEDNLRRPALDAAHMLALIDKRTRRITPRISSISTGSIVYADATNGTGAGVSLRVRETDSSPNVAAVDTIIVPNGSLTDNADGSVTLAYLQTADLPTELWTRTGTVLSPATAGDKVAASGSESSDALLKGTNTNTGIGAYGVAGYITGASAIGAAVFGETQSTNGSFNSYGIVGNVNAASGLGIGVAGGTGSANEQSYGGQFDGVSITARSNDPTSGAAAFGNMTEGNAPANPATGEWRYYFKTDGLYYKDDAGAETGPLGAGGSGAPTDATYVTLTTNGTLTNERVLTAGEGIDLTDAGAGSTITVSAEDASTTNKGILETATDAEATAASATDKAIVPGNFLAGLPHRVIVDVITGTDAVDDYTGYVNCSGVFSSYTITLPSLAGNVGQFIVFKRTDANPITITISGAGTDQIDGAGSPGTTTIAANRCLILVAETTSTWRQIFTG